MKRKQKPWGYDSRGIPFSVGCLPILLIFAALVAVRIFAPNMIEQCVGRPLEPPRGKGGIVYIAIEIVCSPLLIFGSSTEKALFAALIGAGISLFFAWRWTKRHQAYWDGIRAKEKERPRKRPRKKRSKPRRAIERGL
ncbi:MAG: hypothetical protein LW742_09530 [Sphingomonadales bacterium]|nr:hypothetical protein [Sphingomonadales bacterium]